MSNLKMKPEFNDIPGEQVTAGGSDCGRGEASDPGTLECNPMGRRRLRRFGHTRRLAPPRDDGFHLFRVY